MMGDLSFLLHAIGHEEFELQSNQIFARLQERSAGVLEINRRSCPPGPFVCHSLGFYFDPLIEKRHCFVTVR